MFFMFFVLGLIVGICVSVVVVCFNGVKVKMIIVGVQCWRTYYINFGAGPNRTCISSLSLPLDQLIHYMKYAPFKEIHTVLY